MEHPIGRLSWIVLYGSVVLFFCSAPFFVLLEGSWAWIGFGLFSTALSLALLIGDKILLSHLGAFRVRGHGPLVQRVKNLAYRMALPLPAIYHAPAKVPRVLIIAPPLGRKALLIQGPLAESLGDEELDTLLTLSLGKIQNGLGLFHFLFVAVTAVAILPLLVLKGRIQGLVGLALLTFLRPFFYAHRSLSQRFHHLPQGRVLKAVQRKLLSSGGESSYIEEALTGFLSAVEGESDFLIESLLRASR